MGTQLFQAGLQPGACGELWNVERPDVLHGIHRAYLDSGSQLVTTNTFGGTRPQLDQHALGDRTAEINRAAARVAREVAGQGAWVLGDIGPLGDFLEPLGELSGDRATELFAEQAAGLLAGGVDAFIVETMTDPAELALGVKACRALANLPVIATYAFDLKNEQFHTMMGSTIAAAIERAIDSGADVVGANCGTSLGISDYLRLGQELIAVAGATPVILQPNAGEPYTDGDQVIYAATPAEMAELAAELVTMGVRIIGGCCGTTPEHLRAMSQRVRQQSPAS